MKVWIVREKDQLAMDVVFAETRGKAKSMARYTDACCDCDFIDIRVKRFPEADSRYNGKADRMYWDKPSDRLFLVKEAGFYCEEPEDKLCIKCRAKDFCSYYLENKL